MARQRKKGDANAEQQQPANGSGWNPLNLLMNGLIIMFPSQIAINRGPGPHFQTHLCHAKRWAKSFVLLLLEVLWSRLDPQEIGQDGERLNPKITMRHIETHCYTCLQLPKVQSLDFGGCTDGPRLLLGSF